MHGLNERIVRRPAREAKGDRTVAITLVRSLSLILAAFMVGAGFTGYPIPFGDAIYFMPASIQLANGHGLTNPVYANARLYDPLGQARFIYHGFTFELLLATLIKPLMGLYATASLASLAALGLVHAAGVVALSETCVPFLRRSERVVVSCAIAAVGVTTFCALMFAFDGRPEELAAIPLCLVVVAMLRFGVTSSTLMIAGISIGIVATISPIPALLAGLLGSAYFAAVEDLPKWLLHTLVVGLIAVATAFGVTIAIYPYPVIDLIHGIARHAATVETGFAWHVWSVLFANADVPVFGVALALVLTVGTWKALSNRRRWSERAVIAGLAVVFMAALIRCAFNKFLIYNVVPLWPIFLALMLSSTSARPRGKARIVIWPAIVFCALALPSIGFLRMVLLYPTFVHGGIRPALAQSLFARQLAAIPEPSLYVSRSVFLLTDDYARIIDYGEAIPSHAVIVVAQYRSGHQSPAILPGYRLAYENFNPSTATLFGISVAQTIPGYGFAIYRPRGR